MDRREAVLAALAPAKGATHSAVQVQKLLFLIDQNASEFMGGKKFNFRPYNYGPFDKAVYETLEKLAAEGLVTIDMESSWKSYGLTPKGQEESEKIFGSLAPTCREYLEKLSGLILSLSFTELVSAIYKAYPGMRANSVFQG